MRDCKQDDDGYDIAKTGCRQHPGRYQVFTILTVEHGPNHAGHCGRTVSDKQVDENILPPTTKERINKDNSDARLCSRYNYPQKGFETRGTVHNGRPFNIPGNIVEKAFHQPDRTGQIHRHLQQNNAAELVDQVEVAKQKDKAGQQCYGGECIQNNQQFLPSAGAPYTLCATSHRLQAR